jgi:hypothetical protein
MSPDRCAANFGKFHTALLKEGHFSLVIAIDYPGHGRSYKLQKGRLTSRYFNDGKLLLAVLKAFNVTNALTISEGGGSGAFVRAYIGDTTNAVFGPHHIFLNPVMSSVPPEFKFKLGKLGGDTTIFLADGWGPSDTPFSLANCAAFFEFAEAAPERAAFYTLVPPKGPNSITTPGVKAMKDEKYLLGVAIKDISNQVSPNGSYFLLTPSEECIAESIAFLLSPAREPVRDDGGPQAPVQSALMMGKENTSFKVFVRCRPFLKREGGASDCLKVVDVENFPRDPPPQKVTLGSGGGKQTEFVFDRVFQPGAQGEISSHVVAPLVEAVLSGESNATLFAYGQTGSGKTYTMEGPAGEQGCVDYAVHELFKGAGVYGMCISFQYAQLYEKTWLDLLDPSSRRAIKVNEAKAFMTLENATIGKASTAVELLKSVEQGAMFRATGATNMNDASSRSHSVLIVMVAKEGAVAAENGTALYMVDLAGSERVSRSGVTGRGFSEATNINQALSALGRVVLGLVEKDGKRGSHIPYKDNPLTYLLKSGIGGCSKTALVACITAADDSADESLNTLRFATQASHVKNQVADKEAKAAANAKAGEIEAKGRSFVLVDGECEFTLADGKAVKVRGCWEGEDGESVVVCLPDSGQSVYCDGAATQFDAVMKSAQEENGAKRVLSFCFDINADKKPDMFVPVVLEMLDYLGIAKPTFLARDAGALIAVALKHKYPARVGKLILENRRDNMNEKKYKKLLKKDPGGAMGAAYAGPWMLLMGIQKAGECEYKGYSQKKMGKNVTLLWPFQNKGRASTAKGQMCLKMLTPVLGKSVKVVNSHGWEGTDYAKLLKES